MSDKKRIAISSITGLKYDLFRDTSPIFMCDILGFKNYIIESGDEEITKMMVSIADAINYMKTKNVGIGIFKESKELTEKLKPLYPKDYWLDAAIVSDTIVFFPSPKNEENNLSLEVKLLIISFAVMYFYEYMLTKHNKLIRGAVSYGDYYVLDNPKIIFGKNIIQAYELESIQNWSGIVLAPSLSKELKNSGILNSIYNVYPKLPLKDDQRVFDDTITSPPFALNWQRLIKKIDWDPFFQKADAISDEKTREKAKKIISFTKEFLDDMNELYPS